jgi:hypothetical protein
MNGTVGTESVPTVPDPTPTRWGQPIGNQKDVLITK